MGKWALNSRVVVGNLEGFILGTMWFGPGDTPETVEVLTDDFRQFWCRADQVQVVKRLGQTALYSDGVSKTQMYPAEIQRHKDLQEAVHQQRWVRQLFSYEPLDKDTIFWKESYQDFINGRYIPLPAIVDIRKEGECQ